MHQPAFISHSFNTPTEIKLTIPAAIKTPIIIALMAYLNLNLNNEAATFIPTLRDTRPYWYQELEKYSRFI